MTTGTPIAVDPPMVIADDVSPGAREATPANLPSGSGGVVTAEVDEQQLKRSREIWEHVKEEQYEVIEQLPLTLQRYLTLIRELDIQAQAHLDEIPSALRHYRDLRHNLANRKHQWQPDHHHPQQPDTAANAIVSPPLSPSADFTRGRPRPSFSSASLTPVSDSSASSVSDERSRSRDARPLGHDNDPQTHRRYTDGTGTLPQMSSRSLISRIALLATDALRASNEKMNLADAAYAAVDRQMRILDAQIKEHESAIALGLRPGTRPSAIVTSAQQKNEDTSALSQLADMALASATSTLESLSSTNHHATRTNISPRQRVGNVLSAVPGSPKKDRRDQPRKKSNAGTINSNGTGTTATAERRKPKPKTRPQAAVHPNGPAPSNKENQGAGAGAGTEGKHDVSVDHSEPRYCYCNGISSGDMIACDNINCEKEWFHYECVRILKAPPSNSKWYCRDCAVTQPPKKKRKR